MDRGAIAWATVPSPDCQSTLAVPTSDGITMYPDHTTSRIGARNRCSGLLDAAHPGGRRQHGRGCSGRSDLTQLSEHFLLESLEQR